MNKIQQILNMSCYQVDVLFWNLLGDNVKAQVRDQMNIKIWEPIIRYIRNPLERQIIDQIL